MRTNYQGQRRHPFRVKQAVDMTAPETFTTASKRSLTTGRRPDMDRYHKAAARKAVYDEAARKRLFATLNRVAAGFASPGLPPGLNHRTLPTTLLVPRGPAANKEQLREDCPLQPVTY